MKEVMSEITKAEKALKQMKTKKMDAEVIAAQEKVILDLTEQKKKFEKVEKAKADGSLKDVKLTFAIVNEETMEVTEKAYKVAFVKNNRPIDQNKVDGFIAIIAKGKYEKAYPIIAVSARVLIENGYKVVDVDGNEVKEEDADDYIVILDGQHRTKAFLEYCITDPKVVPNTHMREVDNVGEYLVDINRGNKFIQLCKEAGIKVIFIKRRYFINAFNSHALSVGEDAAFETLTKLKRQNLTDETLDAIKDDQGFISILVA